MPKPEERPAARPHDLILESRTTLTVTGVQKVLHCSPESAALETGKGTLHLAGAQLSVVSLDLTNMALHWLQTVCWMLWIFWLPVCRRPHWALSSTGRASTTAS